MAAETNKSPSEWGAEEAKQAIPNDQHAITVRKFYEGDHWQHGSQWIGPFPVDITDKMAFYLYQEVERGFVSKNVIAEVVNRRAGGTIGKEPMFTWTPRRALGKDEEPTEEEQKLIQEANAATTEWWNERDVHTVFEDGVSTALHSEHATFRTYIPKALIQKRSVQTEDGDEAEEFFVEASTIEEALDKIWVEHPEPTVAYVYTVPDTKEKVGVFVFRENNQEKVELVYLDENGETIVRIIGQDGEEEDSVSFAMDKHLTMYTMEHRRFITNQMIQLQNALNLGLTMMPRGLTTSGFLERVLLNAQMPGEFEYDEAGRPIPGSFKPKPYITGAASTNFVSGIQYEETDLEGNIKTKVADPDIKWREPTSIAPIIEGKDALYADMLDSADQAHYLLSGEAAPSGRSRVEARAEYTRTLRRTAKGVNRAGRYIIEAAMAQAEDIAGMPGYFTDTLRVDFNCRIDPGPISSEEQAVVIEASEKNMKPISYAMAELGIDDTDAAMTEIMGQPGYQTKLRGEQAEVIAAFTAAGMPLEVAAFMAGVRKEDLEGMQQELDKLQELYGDGEGVALAAKNAAAMAEATGDLEPPEDEPAVEE